MKVIITGAAGFIGSHLVRHFLSSGADVVGIDNFSRPGNMSNLQKIAENNKEFSCLHADVRSSSDVMRVFADHREAQVVIHQAAQVAVTTSLVDPRGDFETNALGTFNVLEATRLLLRPETILLYASTNKVYGKMEDTETVESEHRYNYRNLPSGVSESATLDFYSPYGCSKGSAEQYVRDYRRIFGLRTVVFRQSCIYGTQQFGMEDQGWVAWLTIASVLGKPITIYGNGKQVRDLLWIDDLVALYARSIEQIDVAAGEIYNAGGGCDNTLSLLELLDLLETYLQRPIQRRFSTWRPGDQRVFIANCHKAGAQLSWKPTVAPVEGIARLLRWVETKREVLAQLHNNH